MNPNQTKIHEHLSSRRALALPTEFILCEYYVKTANKCTETAGTFSRQDETVWRHTKPIHINQNQIGNYNQSQSTNESKTINKQSEPITINQIQTRNVQLYQIQSTIDPTQLTKTITIYQ